MIDDDGFRFNIGIILVNQAGRLFWARRIGQNAWQFPQGGMQENETPEQTMYRELDEEVGLSPEDVEILGCTRGWLRYRLPKRFIRAHVKPICLGQKQKWYLLRLTAPDSRICLNKSSKPEFDHWRWVNYWYPLKAIIAFKRQVYRRALQELASITQLEKRKRKTES